jgi:hypothetical protein
MGQGVCRGGRGNGLRRVLATANVMLAREAVLVRRVVHHHHHHHHRGGGVSLWTGLVVFGTIILFGAALSLFWWIVIGALAISAAFLLMTWIVKAVRWLLGGNRKGIADPEKLKALPAPSGSTSKS